MWNGVLTSKAGSTLRQQQQQHVIKSQQLGRKRACLAAGSPGC